MQAAELLIKQGMADIEAEDDSGRTAMSHAAKHGSMDCLNLLGKEHADVFHKDNEGKTPLQIAEVSSRHEVVTALKKLQQVITTGSSALQPHVSNFCNSRLLILNAAEHAL